MFIFHIRKLIISNIGKTENSTINTFLEKKCRITNRKKLKDFKVVAAFISRMETLSRKLFTTLSSWTMYVFYTPLLHAYYIS